MQLETFQLHELARLRQQELIAPARYAQLVPQRTFRVNLGMLLIRLGELVQGNRVATPPLANAH